MRGRDQSDDRLYQDPDLAQFYDLDNGWGPDLDYCLDFAKDAGSVLDLGCGTGQLAVRLAEGRTVVGVDPAEAMLEIARRRPGGRRVVWVRSDARNLRLGRRFDLVLLTGHAFQVFLTDRAQEAVFSTIAEHLDPAGRFVFDTRNPAAKAWREWIPDRSRRHLVHPQLGDVEAWNDAVPESSRIGPITGWSGAADAFLPPRGSASRPERRSRRG
jgi:SAM-dependent methyltransferase